MNIHEFLTRENIPFEVIPHRATFTASSLAEAVDERGDYVAKQVVLKADGEFVLAVLPASHNVDMLLARDAIGCQTLELADEHDLESLFPDCELGAIPPFGTFYGLKTWVDAQLAEDDHIVFEGQVHNEAIRLTYSSYYDAENPMVGYISHHI